MAHCTSNPMGKAAIVHTNYPIKTEKLFCGGRQRGLGFGGGGEKKWAGERGVIRKMGILEVDNWAQKPTHLQTDLQVIKHINPSSSFLYHKLWCLTLYLLQPQRRNAQNVWEYQTSLGFTPKIKKKEVSAFKLRQIATLQIHAPFLQTYLRRGFAVTARQAPHTSARLKAVGRGSEHGKTPRHKS